MPATRFAIGQRFERLVITAAETENRVVCQCDCGTVGTFYKANLARGATKSCGCLKANRPRKPKKQYARPAEFWIWRGMIKRCHLPTDKKYGLYGGRGIAVCDRWRDSYEAFLADMGPKPFEDATIDRIDNDRGYEPGNCRWTTYAEQNRNRRGNVVVEFGGERMVIEDWAKRLGMSPSSISKRLRSWPVAEALTLPRGAARLEAA